MNDPEVAFPLWEHVADLGLDVVAVHKAFPFGAVPMDSYKVGDVERRPRASRISLSKSFMAV